MGFGCYVVSVFVRQFNYPNWGEFAKLPNFLPACFPLLFLSPVKLINCLWCWVKAHLECQPVLLLLYFPHGRVVLVGVIRAGIYCEWMDKLVFLPLLSNDIFL